MSNDWIDAEGFRANVGIILTDANGRVFWAGRAGRRGWQFPQGGMNTDETPVEAMYRELREETGCTAAEVQKLTAMMTTPGFCSEILHIYLATGLRDGEQQLEEGEESITLLRMPLSEAIAMCRDGRIGRLTQSGVLAKAAGRSTKTNDAAP